MNMKLFRLLAVAVWSIGALLVFQSTAMADTATIYLTSAGADASHGVYISPYYGSVNGGPTQPLVCDDFGDNSYIPETWLATVYNGSGNLSQTRMAALSGLGSNPTALNKAYDAAAYLVLQLQGANAASRTLTSFAIWDIFRDHGSDGSDYVAPWLASDPTFLSQVQATVANAYANATSGERSILTIYSSPITCLVATDNCNAVNNPPQEFLGLSVPEPESLALLGIGLIGIGLIGRKRRFSGIRY
jgi:hypothetical protein